MAEPSVEIIAALRETAGRMETDVAYAWGHHGCCNCGHLVQTITQECPGTLQNMAIEKPGDWGDKMRDYCPTSGFSVDEVITRMLAAGFTTEDLYNLERLSDWAVLAQIPRQRKPLRHNRREDAIVYLKAWADLLEAQVMGKVEVKAKGVFV